MAGAAGADSGLRVVIDARLTSGQAGGVEGVVIGLAHGLAQLEGPEEYVFVARDGETEWLEPYAGGGVRIERQAAADPPDARAPRPRQGRHAKRRASPLTRFVRRLRRGFAGARPGTPGGRGAPPAGSHPEPDPFIDALRPDVVHMPIQRGFLTAAPAIYHPHDLQHVHLPQFFNEGQRQWRERWYGELCRRAAIVAVASEWTRRDVIDHFDLPADKVWVVPLAPPLAATRTPTPAERAEVRARLGVPSRYVIYPAQTWPHKNHLRLLGALGELRRRRGLTVPLVATGRQTDYFEELELGAAEFGIADQVRWTGFIEPVELQALVFDATAVVIPTLFEAASAPLWEAWAAGVPAACSNVTSLPDEAGDAAIVFDPLDIDAIAAAIATLWQDEGLRERLVQRGRARVANLSWDRTARIFRAHYRRLAGRALSEEELELTRQV